MLTRCNECGKLFQNDVGLIKVVETSYTSGKTEYEKYENQTLIETEDRWDQVIDACPHCMTDDFLMDLYDIGLSEVSEELNYRDSAGSESRLNDALAHISTDELEVMETILEEVKTQ